MYQFELTAELGTSQAIAIVVLDVVLRVSFCVV